MKELSIAYEQMMGGKAQIEKAFDKIFEKCFLKNQVEAAEFDPDMDQLKQVLDFATITAVS